MFDQEVAEHESAHVVVARHFGVTVREIRADAPQPGAAGSCSYDPRGWFPEGTFGGRSLERIAAARAPEVWFSKLRRREFPRPSGFAGDREIARAVLHATTPHATGLRMEYLSRAESLALQVLEERRDDVMTLAQQLQRFGYWSSATGWPRRV